MARETILVNLQRCTGCWSCSLGCKMVNELDDDTFRITVRTLGNGNGIDRPKGVWPAISMSWQPEWSRQCTSCAEGKTDHGMFCVYTCPSRALMCGEEADAEAKRLAAAGFEVFELPEEEGTRPNVKYARPAAMPAPTDWERFEIEEAEVMEDGAFVPTLDGITIGELAGDPRTAALLAKHLPWLDLASPEGAQAAGMTLAGMAPFTQGLLDDDTLAALGKEFAKIGLGTMSVDETPIGEIAGNSAGAEMLAEFLPWLDLASPEGAQASGMTLAAMQPFTQGLLDDDTLAAISDRIAKYAPKPSFSIAESLIGDIAKDAEGAAILAKHIPWLDMESPEGSQSVSMTLSGMAPFTQGLLDDDTLAAIEADFKALAAGIFGADAAEGAGLDAEAASSQTEEVSATGSMVSRPAGGYSLKTKIRDLEKDPEAWAILAKHMPGFEIGSKEAKQAGSMSISMMAKFAKDLLTPEVLEQIETDFKALGGVVEEKPKKKGFFARLFGK